jgi:hypothetical protein
MALLICLKDWTGVWFRYSAGPADESLLLMHRYRCMNVSGDFAWAVMSTAAATFCNFFQAYGLLTNTDDERRRAETEKLSFYSEYDV